ncbi:hypothetical protein FB45DRAFT_749221, partial [Roridomyces roridus]
IVGGRKVGHLLSNLEALDISLSQEHIDYLESVTPLDPGFPNSLMVRFFSLSESNSSGAIDGFFLFAGRWNDA